ncbi:hypothetical protein QQG74_21795 [Micromonospora sp. FIMYZ51]|uniref:hypothetical protein n=1 Tax=Micromonospora sp. FIMYZ51 TaxID=3051832 RepID=UPI00311E3147
MLDSTDARALAEFYRQLLGFVYRPGDEPSADGRDDERGRDPTTCTPTPRRPAHRTDSHRPRGGASMAEPSTRSRLIACAHLPRVAFVPSPRSVSQRS